MNKIYVFTGTGNSLMMANRIATELGNAEVLSISKLMRQKTWNIEGDSIGFVFPCYYGTAPQIVRRFIEEAEHVSANYTFAIATAGRETGYSLKHINACLELHNLQLDYGKSIEIASNYMNGWYYEMIMPNPDVISKNIDAALKSTTTIVNSIRSKHKEIDLQSYMGYLLPNIMSPNRYIRDTRQWDKEFEVGNTCDQCGLCTRICPVQNIDITNGKHQFNGNCQRCMACIQYCPKSAFVIKGKTMDKVKYVNPIVSTKELIHFHK